MKRYRNEKESAKLQYRHDRPTIVTRAETVGYFSVDGDRNYLPDSSKLLYHNPPDEKDVIMDLNAGIENAIRRKDTFYAEGIEHILKWIKGNEEKIKPPPDTDRWIEPNFVCSRGLLIKFLTAPYSPTNSWKIYAAKWKGTIYLRVDKAAEKLFEIDSETNKKYTSWGHKFEQYVLSDTPDTAPDASKPVIEPEEFRCVYRQHFYNHTILFSTVVKGVCSKKRLHDPLPIKTLKFIDLKTARMPEHAGHEKTLRKHKFLKWWCMGFMTNTERTLCGFRDDNGIVLKMSTFSLDQMVNMSRAYWDPAVCIASCNTFLTKLAEFVVHECDETIYEFTKVSHEDFNITELAPTAANAVLPLWYMSAMG